MTEKFLPSGRMPTRDDILRLAAVEPVAKACLYSYHHEGWSWEGTLMMIALAYADRNKALLDSLSTLYASESQFWLPGTGGTPFLEIDVVPLDLPDDLG